jgi:uncharacterized protein
MLQNLPDKAQQYVENTVFSKLSPQLLFHNYEHTSQVVRAAAEIGRHEKLGKEEMEMVIIAAWFHDCGYLYTYTGHEAKSVILVQHFLKEMGVGVEKTRIICGCIQATRLPQQPGNLLQKVICDADFYHRSQTCFHQRSLLLREEWQLQLNLAFSDWQWYFQNVEFMVQHTYFTHYSQTVLTKGRQANMLAELTYLHQSINRLVKDENINY